MVSLAVAAGCGGLRYLDGIPSLVLGLGFSSGDLSRDGL